MQHSLQNARILLNVLQPPERVQLPRLGFDDRRHPRDQPVNGTAKSL
jgi:hypothetical protein